MTGSAGRGPRSPGQWWVVATVLAVCALAIIVLEAAREPATPDNAEWLRKGGWERAYFATNTLLVGVALGALGMAWRQAELSREQSRRMLEQTTIMAEQAH